MRDIGQVILEVRVECPRDICGILEENESGEEPDLHNVDGAVGVEKDPEEGEPGSEEDSDAESNAAFEPILEANRDGTAALEPKGQKIDSCRDHYTGIDFAALM